MKIESTENRITGNWKFSNGKMITDENCHRIQYLITEILQKIATDESGWRTLFLNTDDNCYWELTYPDSEMHGGGPPELTKNSRIEELEKRYNIYIQH